MASICSAVGFGVKQETTAINTSRNTNNQTSKISQFVCQNHEVYSQKAPSIVALPESVITLVSKRTIPIRKPPISPHSPALGVIFLENIPNVNTATIAGAINDWISCRYEYRLPIFIMIGIHANPRRTTTTVAIRPTST